MTPFDSNRLRAIRNLSQLVAYLRDELSWPIDQDAVEDDLTFEYQPEELGISAEGAVAIKDIKQIRPLDSHQPWGVFWVNFEKKRLPVVMLRRILSRLVIKRRASPAQAKRRAWHLHDLLFISSYGEEHDRAITLAHFSQDPDNPGDLPVLKVLGWDGADTVLHLADAHATLVEKLRWPAEPSDIASWRSQWAGAFRHRLGHTIRTANDLAETLAALARDIRDRCQTILAKESERGPLTKLYKAFQAALIHDLTPATFADTYAQTITYGLFTAAVNRTDMSGGTEATYVKADDMALMARSTSPFLKEMLETFLRVGGRKNGVDFDELGIQDVVELLRGDETDLPAILRDFGNRTRGDDPVIHFYEHFLSAYNKKLKVQRGVFYTPQPVVSYIVRSVHELLQTEFGLEDGLASTVTWGEMRKKNPDLKLPPLTDEPDEKRTVAPDEPFVQILDPATGTATFLVEVIDVIHRHLRARWEQGGFAAMPRLPNAEPRAPANFAAYWNAYVPAALLPRLHGYELLAAPYAIAHLKLGLKLTETGYHFASNERARIYLTNALEPKVRQLPQIGFEPLAHEAQAVNEIKWYKRFTVVIGNPPYSYMSANLTSAAAALIEPFRHVDGEKIRERSALSLERSLQDDFVKFFGLALRLKQDTGGAFVLGLITNNSYMDSALHRGVRGQIVKTLERIYVVNLFGDSIKDREENVFDIQQGVAVFLGAKLCKEETTEISISEVHGTRVEKYATLAQTSWSKFKFQELKPLPPQRYFIRLETGGEYPAMPSLADIFPLTSTCIKTLKDALATHFDKAQVEQNIELFRRVGTKKEDIERRFGVEDVVQWKIEPARRETRNIALDRFLTCYQARPFDYRWMFYHNSIVGSPRAEVMRNLARPSSRALIANRKVRTGDCQHFWVTSRICVSEIISSADNSNCFPLYIVSDEHDLGLADSRPNLSSGFLNALAAKLVLPQKGDHGLPLGLTPEDIFHYIYAVFHSPGYRKRYAEFLKIDFPRLPLTSSLGLFRGLAKLGGELVALHLLESPKVEKFITEYVGGRAPEVEKVSWSKNAVWLDKAQTAGFKGVREDVWNFHIGGYQVCEKWLKDRKGRKLLKDDIAHYQKIVVALAETIRLMAEIDRVIEKHGGWPGAFVTGESAAPSAPQSAPAAPSRPSVVPPRALQSDLPLAAEESTKYGADGDRKDPK